MASAGYLQVAALLLAVLLRLGAADADQETGTVIPAESRPCVDCHAFEFMQRALQDLKKTAFNLDARCGPVWKLLIQYVDTVQTGMFYIVETHACKNELVSIVTGFGLAFMIIVHIEL
ncbi:uncharacterized protein V6R79_015785 [Siganus canaliculatus]